MRTAFYRIYGLVLSLWPRALTPSVGRLHCTPNRDRKFGSPNVYFRVQILSGDGEPETLLLTFSEIHRIRQRVAENQEELVQPSWIDRLWSCFNAWAPPVR